MPNRCDLKLSKCWLLAAQVRDICPTQSVQTYLTTIKETQAVNLRESKQGLIKTRRAGGRKGKEENDVIML